MRSAPSGPWARGPALAVAVAVAFAGCHKLAADNAAAAGAGDGAAVAGAAAGFCRGRVTDRGSRPMSPLARPEIGAWVNEPDFGTRITRVTAAAAGEAITPVYSTVPAWNADGSLLLLYRWGGGHELYDGRTLARIGPLVCRRDDGTAPAPSDVEHVMWDPGDPASLLYPSRYAPDQRGPLPLLYRCDVRTHRLTVVHDFSGPPTRCAPGKDELTMGSDPQWFPGDLIGLVCGRTKFIYDLRRDKVYTPRATAPFTDNVAPIAAPSGTVAYYGGRVFDLDLAPLRDLHLANAGEHANLGRSAGGHDIYFAVDFDGPDPGVTVAHDLQTGAARSLISRGKGWGYPPSGVHHSSVVADPRAAGWVLSSVVGKVKGTAPLTMELVLANFDSGAVCRIGRHRSYAREGTHGYRAEPHPVWHLLPDGTLEAAFASDWLGGDRVDTYLLRLAP